MRSKPQARSLSERPAREPEQVDDAVEQARRALQTSMDTRQ
jgi:hypothetical protein